MPIRWPQERETCNGRSCEIRRERGARINSISLVIIVTPWLSTSSTGHEVIYKTCSPNVRQDAPGTADEVANVAELLMSDIVYLSRERTF